MMPFCFVVLFEFVCLSVCVLYVFCEAEAFRFLGVQPGMGTHIQKQAHIYEVMVCCDNGEKPGWANPPTYLFAG